MFSWLPRNFDGKKIMIVTFRNLKEILTVKGTSELRGLRDKFPKFWNQWGRWPKIREKGRGQNLNKIKEKIGVRGDKLKKIKVCCYYIVGKRETVFKTVFFRYRSTFQQKWRRGPKNSCPSKKFLLLRCGQRYSFI